MSKEKEKCFRVYTSHEVADYLRIDEMTVRRYIKAGKIKRVANIGAIRITHIELDRFINGDKCGSQ